MNKKYNLVKGKIGENIAIKYMLDKGYSLVAKNIRDRYGELDLIFTKNSELIFVEVKARTSGMFNIPESALNYDKLRRLKVAATKYVFTRKFNGIYRIDSVCIILPAKKITHYINIVS